MEAFSNPPAAVLPGDPVSPVKLQNESWQRADVQAGANPIRPPEVKEGIAPGPQISKLIELGKVKTDAPEAEEAKVEKQTEETEETNCKHCRRNLKSMLRDPVPTDEDKQRWRRHVLGEPRFRRQYTMTQGSVRVTYRSRTMREQQETQLQQTADAAQNRIDNTRFMSLNANTRVLQLMLAACLERVEWIDNGQVVKTVEFPESGKVEIPAKAAEKGDRSIHFAHENILEKITSEGLYSMLLQRCYHFNSMIDVLIARGDDEDFWQAAGGQG